MMNEKLHPILRLLIQELPPAGSKWSLGEQARWFRAMDAACALVYQSDETFDITVKGGEVSISRKPGPWVG